MLPLRFRVIRPYLASLIHCDFQRPPVTEVLRSLFRPGKEERAAKYILRHQDAGEFIAVYFTGHADTPFFYSRQFTWINLCETVDECFNPENWHEYLAGGLDLRKDDVVVDCGAAEGLFTFLAAPKVKKVFALEPIPAWRPALDKTFAGSSNVEILGVAVGHKSHETRMTNNGVYSGIDAGGELVIPVRTIDELFFAKNQPVTFIKADIEGNEFQALLGAENTIRANRPRLSLTVYHKTNHVVEIQHFLKEIHRDYKFRTRGIADNGNPVLLQVF